MSETSNKYSALCIYLALALTTLAVFWPVRSCDFTNYDDPDYVSKNQHVKAGFTRDSIVWAFTTGHKSNWHPLTWLSHMLDCQLFGLDHFWHHLTSLLFHIANTLLLFGVLKRMTGALWPSAFVAAAFALHPLHVESVAWISERKDVLSTLFWMLTMLAYLRYVKRPGVSSYLLTLLTFALGLMAKPMLVTLPFVLLLLDYWPLARFRLSKAVENTNQQNGKSVNTHSQWKVLYRLILEKVPFFILSAISSVVTFLVQRSWESVVRINEISLYIRIANAFLSYVRYIGKMIWPSRLAIFYPHPWDTLPIWQVLMAGILLLCIFVWVIRQGHRRRYLVTGWLWYLGTLVPVIGLVQVGDQAMADRYTYLPSIGIFIMVAWGAAELLAPTASFCEAKTVSAKRWGRYRRMALGISAGLWLAAMLICSRMQLRHWQNNFTLYEHALKVTENNYKIHNNYGWSLLEKDRLKEALMHFNESLRINPKYYLARNNVGMVFLKQGKLDDAIKWFNQALWVKPNWPDAYSNLATAFYRQGNLEQAVKHWTKAVNLMPDWTEVLNNLAWILATSEEIKFQNPTDAVKFAERACELTDYKQPGMLDTLAVAYAAAGRFTEAVETAERAVELARNAKQEKLAEDIHSRLELYKMNKPYSD